MVNAKRIICFFFAVFICFSVFPISLFASSVNNIYDSYVETDLLKMYNSDFLSKYPADSSDDSVHLIDFTEYGYHEGGNQSYYGIFIYLYNPSGRAVQNYGNSVEMSYKKKDTTQTVYKKYRLKLLSSSEGSTNKNVFLKFWVADSKDFANEIHRFQRQYNVSSLEIQFDNSVGAKPETFSVGGKYIFSGYQENFDIPGGNDGDLFRSYEQFDVCGIELHPASWFSSTASLCGAKHELDCNCEDYRWEVSSVYFNIPDYFINKYGNILDKPSDGGTSGLYSVKGEYTKKVTNGIFTNNKVVYDGLLSGVGDDLSDVDVALDLLGFYNERVSSYSQTNNANYTHYPLCYNIYIYSEKIGPSWNYVTTDSKISSIGNVLKYKTSSFSNKIYIDRDSFLEQYNAQGRNGKVTTDDLSSYNKDKFHKLGYQTFKIQADGLFLNDSFPSYASSSGKSFLFKLFNNNLFVDENGYSECKPIVELTSSSFNNEIDGTSAADKLFVMEDDLTKLKSFYNDKDWGNHVYLMRFDVNPYYAPAVTFVEDANNGTGVVGNGYYFEKAIFEDFDVLEFTFRDKDAKFHTVPVSCRPIDIVGSIIPGNNNITNNNGTPQKEVDNPINWLAVVMLIVALVVIMFLIWLVWRIFGGMILGIIDTAIKVSDSRTRRRQQKADTYGTDKKRKADKKEKRKNKKEKRKNKKEKRENKKLEKTKKTESLM